MDNQVMQIGLIMLVVLIIIVVLSSIGKDRKRDNREEDDKSKVEGEDTQKINDKIEPPTKRRRFF